MLSMVVREGMEERFVRTWRDFADRIGAQPGNLGQAMLRDLRAPRTYLISSDWRDGDALRAFQGTGLRRDLSQALDELRESARNDQYEVVAVYRPTEGEAQ